MQDQQRGMASEPKSCTLQLVAASDEFIGDLARELACPAEPSQKGAALRELLQPLQAPGASARVRRAGGLPPASLRAGNTSLKGMMPRSQATALRCSISASAHAVMIGRPIFLFSCPFPGECIVCLTSF